MSVTVALTLILVIITLNVWAARDRRKLTPQEYQEIDAGLSVY